MKANQLKLSQQHRLPGDLDSILTNNFLRWDIKLWWNLRKGVVKYPEIVDHYHQQYLQEMLCMWTQAMKSINVV